VRARPPDLTRRASTRRRLQRLANWASALPKSPLFSNGDLASNADVSSERESNSDDRTLHSVNSPNRWVEKGANEGASHPKR
jgi:hypothetical protein